LFIVCVVARILRAGDGSKEEVQKKDGWKK
jgi:hypothetical protein